MPPTSDRLLLDTYLDGKKRLDDGELAKLDGQIGRLEGQELVDFCDRDVQRIRFALWSWIMKYKELGAQPVEDGFTFQELFDGLQSTPMTPQAQICAANIIKSVILGRSSIGNYFRARTQKPNGTEAEQPQQLPEGQ